MMKFTYETQDDSKFLVYEKTTADVIDTMALGMLSNNMIEGIVPFIYAQADDTVYMKYNISGLASLEECCTGVLRRKKVLDILGSFAEAVAGAEEYMLESSSFVLELPHIFVDPSDNRVSLIVLPIEREEVPLAVFLRNLVIGMQYDQRENGNYIAALINFFNSDKAFSVHEFQAQVQKLKEEGVDQAPDRIPGQYHIGYQEAAATSQPSRNIPQQASVNASQVWQEQQPQQSSGQLYGMPQQASEQLYGAQSQPSGGWPYGGTQSSAGQPYGTQSQYMQQPVTVPGQEDASPMPGAEMVGSGAEPKKKKGLFGGREKKPKKEKTPKEKLVKEKKLKEKPPKEKKGLFGKKESKKRDKAAAAGNGFGGIAIPGMDSMSHLQSANSAGEQEEYIKKDTMKKKKKVEMEQRQATQQDFGGTVDLQTYMNQESADETVDLKTYQQSEGTTLLIQQQAPAMRPHLCRLRTKEVFWITKEITKIGRNADAADICIIGNSAVGRVHAVLYMQNGSIGIGDNESKNGTYVNEIKLYPAGAPVPLNHGSVIRLGDEELEFRMYE